MKNSNKTKTKIANQLAKLFGQKLLVIGFRQALKTPEGPGFITLTNKD